MDTDEAATAFADAVVTETREQILQELEQTPDPEPTTPEHYLGDGDSLQEAIDDGHHSIFLSPDYDPTVENYPVVADLPDKTGFSLRGCGPGVSHVGVPDLESPALVVRGNGAGSYRYAPTLGGFSVPGGRPGVAIHSAPYTHVQNVYLSTDGNGVSLLPDERGGSYGTTFQNVQAWNCPGNGFHLTSNSHPHGTTFTDAHAIACKGAGFRLRGSNVTLKSGSSQLNHSYGVSTRAAMNHSLQNVYIEGNARKKDYPVEIYARGSHALTVQNCYLHGINPRGADHGYPWVLRGVNVHDSEGVTLTGNKFRRYGVHPDLPKFSEFEEEAGGAIALFGCEDVAVDPRDSLRDITRLFDPAGLTPPDPTLYSSLSPLNPDDYDTDTDTDTDTDA